MIAQSRRVKSLSRAFAAIRASQKSHSVFSSGPRSQVEQAFGIFKRSYGLARARYRGEVRNAAHFLILATAYNLRRALSLV